MMKKQRPQKPKSGFIFFSQERRKTLRKEQPDLSILEIAKVMGREWKEIDESNKAKYQQLADNDKARYLEEKIALMAAKNGKNPKEPKKPKSAFMFFSMERRESLQKEQPNLAMLEASKLIGNEWKEMEESDKAKYQQLADNDKARYFKEKEDISFAKSKTKK